MRMHSPSHSKRHASQTKHCGPSTASDFSPRNWNFAATSGSSTTSGIWSRGRSSKTFTGQTSRQCEQPVHFASSMSTWTIRLPSGERAGLFSFTRGWKVFHGPECIVCEACLFECEGECILITDDENHVHKSTYK